MSTTHGPTFVSRAGRLLYEQTNSGPIADEDFPDVLLVPEGSEEQGTDFESAIITSYELCRSVLRDDVNYSSHQAPFGHLVNPEFPGGAIAPGTILRYDGTEHKRLRALVMGDFTVRAIERHQEFLHRTANRLLDDLLGELEADVIEAFAVPMTTVVTCHLMGVPRSLWEQFADWAFDVNDLAAAADVRERADRNIHEALRALLSDAQEGVLAQLAQRCERSELTDDEAVLLAATLLVAGIETTANAIGMALQWVINNPQRLEAEVRCVDLDSLCEELLRHQTVVRYGVARVALRDQVLDGCPIRPGTVVVPSLWHANRDSRFISQSEDVEPGRSRSRHLSFGSGAHQCLGQYLARAELREALHAFLERVEGPLVVPDSNKQRTSTVYGPKNMRVAWSRIAPRWSCIK